MKLKQILALLGVILLVGLYLSTIVFALRKDPAADNWLMASIISTIAIPILIYGGTLIAKALKDHNPKH